MVSLRESLQKRILLLDGGTGSVLMSGNNDALCITQPEAVRNLHRKYLEAGADIITTNTFCAQRISQREYHLEDKITEINRAGARLAREEADRMTQLTPERPRYVLGDVGPTNKMLSMSEDVNVPEARAITFDEMEANYMEQIEALMEEGVDGILVETIFDTLNAKAAISAFLRTKEKLGPDTELLLSMTISDSSGRLLSGQTVEAFITSVMHANPLSVGLNCGMGASGMMPYLRRMAQFAPCYVSCHPNAGLPNQFGEYDETPETMRPQMQEMVEEGLVNIIGGCCGTTPAHIKEMRKMLDEKGFRMPRSLSLCRHVVMSSCREAALTTDKAPMVLAGLEHFEFSPSDFVCIGERCNVAGSRKFLRLINEKKYEEALSIARKQVEDGAQAIDINMDDGLLDAQAEMRTFVNLLMSDPAISRVPLMIDSSRFEVIEEGLKCCQGKCIVNSISLKMGEEDFLKHAKVVKRLGAAVIVMCFDEEGQATDYERRVAICKRAYKLLTEKVGFSPSDIIFDPNVLTIATGMEEHANYAKDFIRATKWVTDNLKGTRVSGGLSNLSFAFRGNNYIREAMHSVFLHYAIQNGMGMAIMNPATRVDYDTIPAELQKAIADVVLNSDAEASERLIELAGKYSQSAQSAQNAPSTPIVQSNLTTEERLRQALVKGGSDTLNADIMELIGRGDKAIDIISGPLMDGMNEVGELFGAGKMFLPQVVKTARTMKQAVDILRPYMLQGDDNKTSKAAKILIATVKGDVHDIGKNIVAVVLTCNNFEVLDLGVMVPKETIVETAIKEKVDMVCLSGLITPSLEEMGHTVQAMKEAGLNIPVMVGGATTSALHTAVKIAPLYDGSVFHVRDASADAVMAMKLVDPQQRQTVIDENYREQEELRVHGSGFKRERGSREKEVQEVQKVQEVQEVKETINPEPLTINQHPSPLFLGQRVLQPIPISSLLTYFNWKMFYLPWKVKEDSAEALELKKDAEILLDELKDNPVYGMRAIQAFYPAHRGEDSIVITKSDCPCCTNRLLHKLRTVEIPTPRQQWGEHKSLCDYVSADGNDYIGMFAATVSQAFIERLEHLKKMKGNSDYDALLMQTVGDRLVEAASEYLHRQTGWDGIRPAIGYPSLPDQHSIFILAEAIDFKRIGISLTENGAMYPQASVCGLYIGNPKAEYFPVSEKL